MSVVNDSRTPSMRFSNIQLVGKKIPEGADYLLLVWVCEWVWVCAWVFAR